MFELWDLSNPENEKLTTPFTQIWQGLELLDNILDSRVEASIIATADSTLRTHRTANHVAD